MTYVIVAASEKTGVMFSVHDYKRYNKSWSSNLNIARRYQSERGARRRVNKILNNTDIECVFMPYEQAVILLKFYQDKLKNA